MAQPVFSVSLDVAFATAAATGAQEAADAGGVHQFAQLQALWLKPQVVVSRDAVRAFVLFRETLLM